ncbi:MAG: nucleotidyl transferase AbiEii/AbiGii toxin family protein [Nitrosopumilaceae archaeon]|nr:nucleotidyl transferase AbiEii/AbiGii toxin family protein [Nitrosopumilaceae archaeon]
MARPGAAPKGSAVEMGAFFFIDDRLVNLDDPTAMVKDEHYERFARREFAPFIRSEICALDMLYAVADMRDGHYVERLSLRGGLSVRSVVPLADHRFSFDADFSPNTPGGFTYRHVGDLKSDMMRYGTTKGCKTRVRVTTNDAKLFFMEVGYRKSLGPNHGIIEPPKIEVCKTCRVLKEPVLGPVETIIDLDILGLDPPKIAHLSLEEQLATKLFVIGSSGRQRNHFDAYDSFRILKHNEPDMRRTRDIFKELCGRHKSRPSVYASECRRQLDAMRKNSKKRASLEETAFADEFDFNAMVATVNSFYDF